MLNKLNIVTRNNLFRSDPRNNGKRINASQGLDVLNRINMDNIPSEKMQ